MGVWEEHAYCRRDEKGNIVTLEQYKAKQSKAAFSFADLKLYMICGVGFMIDAYDLFIVNQSSPIWAYQFFTVGDLNTTTAVPAPKIPLLLRGAVNAAANIGNVFGQVGFGFLGDSMGRKYVYGKELIFAMLGIILVISLPWKSNALDTGIKKMWWLFSFRLLLGFGIGGDYPMSATIVAERSTLANRGRMLGWIFSNQGWGTLFASFVTLILLACFKVPLTNGHFSRINAVWRLQIGLALIPCAALLYFRLTMPESKNFLQSTEISRAEAASRHETESISSDKKVLTELYDAEGNPITDPRVSIVESKARESQNMVINNKQGEQWDVFRRYFSNPRHALTLFGTASTWFLVDVAFYGINLNQSVILTDIGYATGKDPWDYLKNVAVGNLIIAVAGYVPGYFITIAFIEILGRKFIQILGFTVTAITFAILAGANNSISSNARFGLIIITQLFMNFGPNATTFIVPGEVFPSRVRGLAHGFSAAVGKLGAILSGIGFNYWSQKDHVTYPHSIGLSGVLWIFCACEALGAVITFFCVPETRGMDADAIDFEECVKSIHLNNAMHNNNNVDETALPDEKHVDNEMDL